MNEDEKVVEQTEQEVQAEETVQAEEAQPSEVETLTAQVEELKEKLLYKQAEFENYRRRVIKEKAELLLGGAEKTVLAMLPVADDLERALAGMAKAQDVDAVREGVELIAQKFASALESIGVKAINTKEADFNTDMHEAVAQIPAPNDDTKGKVMDEVQKGYTLNEKVIRFAKVVVGI